MCVNNHQLVKAFKIANFIDGVRRACEIDYTESVYRKDGSLRKGYAPLELAIKNAHHDEPGLWEKRAEEY